MRDTQSVSAPQSTLPWILALAACGAGLAVALLVGAQPSVMLPFATVALCGGAVALLLHPHVGVAITMFLFYLNIQPLLANEHGLPVIIAAALPLLFAAPLAIRMLTSPHVSLKHTVIYTDSTFMWMCFYLIALIISTIAASDIRVASVIVIDYIVWGLALYIVLVNYNRSPHILRLTLWALVLAGMFMAGITLFQEITQTYSNTYGGFAPLQGSFLDNNTGDWRTRPAGPVGDTNRYAQILLVLVPLALYQFRVERGLLRLLALAAATTIMLGVLLTYSRGAGVAMILMLPAMAVLWQVKLRHIAIGLTAGILLIVVAVPGFIDRMETLTQSVTIIEGDSTISEQPDRSTLSRATKNVAAIRMFLDHPIIGVGPAHFAFYSPRYADNSISSEIDITGSHAHNLYLGLAAEVGIVGLIGFFGAFFASFISLWRVRQRFRDDQAGIRSAAEAVMVSLLTYAFTAIFLHLSYQRYFWLLLALAGAVVVVANRFQEEPDALTDAGSVDEQTLAVRH